MKKLMDEEIIKALECWGKEYSCERCILNTWLNKKRDCVGTILGGALDLINRQKAEIESLKHRKTELQIRNQELQHEKSEAIKEFAERLKDEMRLEDDCQYDCMNCLYECKGYVLIIDNLVKEMTEVETNQRKEDEGK